MQLHQADVHEYFIAQLAEAVSENLRQAFQQNRISELGGVVQQDALDDHRVLALLDEVLPDVRCSFE